ncbi:MAG: carboxypeptidase-like regulatory domain-containing protein [Ignavibacteriales bacterium]|nr:MAG: carboxypeptidase-like regulatory domain-containing protein [Ignavibacteriales bacterium]
MKRFWLLTFLFTSSILVNAQTGKLVGVVEDGEFGNPISYANIIIKGTELGAATNSSGKYIMLKIPAGKYDVSCSLYGYYKLTVENVTINENDTTEVNFNLLLDKKLFEKLPLQTQNDMRDIRKDDPGKFANLYYRKSFEYSSGRYIPPDDEADKRSIELFSLDMKAELLGMQYKKANDTEKQQIKLQLEATLKQLISSLEVARKNDVNEIEKRLNDLKKSLDNITNNKNKVIKERIDELLK